jgi:hypothetical protein
MTRPTPRPSLDFLAAVTVLSLVVGVVFAIVGWSPYGAFLTAIVSGVGFRWVARKTPKRKAGS